MLRCSIGILLPLLLGLHVGVFLVHSSNSCPLTHVTDRFFMLGTYALELLTVFRLLSVFGRSRFLMFFILRMP